MNKPLSTKPGTDIGFSPLTLGTVQFGLDYGIANEGGKPEYKTCRDIVACALEEGISCFDTAAAYGESEQVLGKILAELKVADQVAIVSKSCPVGEAGIPSDRVPGFIEDSLIQSLENLKVEALPVFLFHRDDDLVWMDTLAAMREKGLVRNIGISVDTAAGAEQAAENKMVQAIQLPHNLFDRRFSSGPLFGQLRERKVKLFVRSAFLQGLLLMAEERIPAHLGAVVPVRRKLQRLAAESGISMAELCLRYSLSFPAFTSVLVGVDSVGQLRENAAMARRGPLEDSLLGKIEECVPEFPESIVRPACWAKARREQETCSEQKG